MNIEVYKRLMNNPHPNIRQVYVEDGKVSEMHLVGNTLDELGYFSRTDFINICVSLLKAVEHIHSLGIIHKDIKPQNIIIGENNNPYLIDFDISIMYNSVEKRQTLEGTIDYMPPEQISKSNTNFKTDIYSLCMTLLEKSKNHKDISDYLEKGTSLNSNNRDITSDEFIRIFVNFEIDEEQEVKENIRKEEITNSNGVYFTNKTKYDYKKLILMVFLIIVSIILVNSFSNFNNIQKKEEYNEAKSSNETKSESEISSTSEKDTDVEYDYSEDVQKDIGEDGINDITNIDITNLINMSQSKDGVAISPFSYDENTGLITYKTKTNYYDDPNTSKDDYNTITIDSTNNIVFMHGAYKEVIKNNKMTCYLRTDKEKEIYEKTDCERQNENDGYFANERIYIDFPDKGLYDYIKITKKD